MLTRTGECNDYAYAGDDPINESDPSGLCPGLGNAPDTAGIPCTPQQVVALEQAASEARANNPVQSCSNTITCILIDPGSIVASFDAHKKTIAISVGIVLGVAAAATGVGALAEGSVLLGGAAAGLAGGGAFLDYPQCVNDHNSLACVGLAFNGGGAVAGIASAGALVLGAEGASALFGAFGINFGLAGLTVDITGFLVGPNDQPSSCVNRT
jgi:hypothetical protein